MAADMSSVADDGVENSTLFMVVLAICALAVLVNALVITVIVTKYSHPTSVDVFLINLAVIDILLAGLVHPLQFYNVFLQKKSFIGGKRQTIFFLLIN